MIVHIDLDCTYCTYCTGIATIQDLAPKRGVVIRIWMALQDATVVEGPQSHQVPGICVSKTRPRSKFAAHFGGDMLLVLLSMKAPSSNLNWHSSLSKNSRPVFSEVCKQYQAMIMVISYIRYQMTVVLMGNGYSNGYSNGIVMNHMTS